MPIKVVCVTNTDGLPRERVILEKASTAVNLISIADRFLALQHQHALAIGSDFVDLRCVLDEIHIPTRSLIESCSTAFNLMRVKLFCENGFAVFKHEADVDCFMGVVRAGGQLGGMPAPKWMGGMLKSAGSRKVPLGSSQTVRPTGAIQTAVQAAVAALPSEPAAVVPPPKQPRRLSAVNLGKIGNLLETHE